LPPRRVSARLLKLEYEDRCRVARELRESTAQDLAALKINLGVIEKSGSRLGPRARRALAECLALAEGCSREIRTLSNLLHPVLLEEFGLASALRSYMEGLAKRSGLQLRLTIDDYLLRRRWSRELETTLFLAVQEGLANVWLHSSGKTADVEVNRDLRSNCIVLQVKNAGPRTSTRATRSVQRRSVASSGLGIHGIKERVQQLGGRLALKTTKRATILTVALPLP
jgi:signal transduction histidine kinase